MRNFDEETAAIKKQRERIRNQVREVKKHYQFLKQQAIQEMRYSSSANRKYAKLTTSRANSRGGVVTENPIPSPRNEEPSFENPHPDKEDQPEEAQDAEETQQVTES